MWFLAMYNVTKIFNIRCLYVLYCKNIVESSAFCPLIPAKRKKEQNWENREEEKALTIIVTDAVCKLSVYKRCGEEREREKGRIKIEILRREKKRKNGSLRWKVKGSERNESLFEEKSA